MTPLRIVKRDDKYIVQIGDKSFWPRKIKWTDLWYRVFQNLNYPIPGGLLPKFPAGYADLNKAESFCRDYYLNEKSEIEVIKTYNTNNHDVVWPRE